MLKLITNTEHNSSRRFFFVYNFLKNQVTTKPFEDIVSCQINGERSSIRLHSTVQNLKEFFKQENDLEVYLFIKFKFFCSKTKFYFLRFHYFQMKE